MKSKRWTDAMVQCPFYKSQDAQIVYCKGMEEGNPVHNAFSTPQKRKEWQMKYCRTDYKACWICKAHLEVLSEKDS